MTPIFFLVQCADLNAEYFYPFIGVKKQKVGTRYIYVCEVKSMFEYIANLCETQRDL